MKIQTWRCGKSSNCIGGTGSKGKAVYVLQRPRTH